MELLIKQVQDILYEASFKRPSLLFLYEISDKFMEYSLEDRKKLFSEIISSTKLSTKQQNIINILKDTTFVETCD